MTSSESPDSGLKWDFGTAYEFFISLHVLHEPEFHGVRASWAAGVRSRIPAPERKLLEDIIPFLAPPVGWIHTLPEPKDSQTALNHLRQIPAADRIGEVFKDADHLHPETYFSLLQRIAQQAAWEQSDLQALRKLATRKDKARFNDDSIRRFLDWWIRPEALGEGYLNAMQAYYQAFFQSEEQRVAPVLQAGLERARGLAEHMCKSELLTELSQGVKFADGLLEKELILAPAYWTTPLVIYRDLDENRTLILFGARPAHMSDIPGELVPDDLLRKLKALADPTRLKILRYLSQEELMPSELARRLHLRAPTVTHHLSELRLAGLVNLRLQGQEKRYTARQEALRAAFESLHTFLNAESEENTPR